MNAQPQVTSGQTLIQWEEEYNNDYAAGYVYRQSPVSGCTVREGQTITLTVSLGTKYITVPDLANYLQTDAERLLREQGVSVLVTQAVEPSVATGSVIRTEPAAGSQVAAAGTTVIVYVSRPQVNTSTRVPALEGGNWGMSTMPAPCWCRTAWAWAARPNSTAIRLRAPCSARARKSGAW